MGRFCKNIQSMLVFFKASFLALINQLPPWWCGTGIYTDNTILYFKYDQTFYLFQQLDLASELESNLRDIVDCGRKWLVGFNAWKTQVVLFHRSNNSGGIDVNMNGSVLDKINHLLRWWDCLSLPNWTGARTLSPLLKCAQEIWSLDPFYKLSFSQSCSLSPRIYYTALNGILFPCLGRCY